MNIPKKVKHLQELVKNQIPESLHLDYKASPALIKKKKDEICKDISSFANSDGGMLIYGIEEVNNLPDKLDDGVDIKTINREWIDQIVSTHITPPIEDLEIIEVENNKDRSFFVINIPKSFRGPHQSPDKKYYKRYNFRSSPMEHYEIEDIRNRSISLPPLVNMDVSILDQLIRIVIENNGNQIAQDVKFQFPDNFKWYRGTLPHALNKGIKFFPPGRKITFTLGTTFQILSENSEFVPYFDVCISYLHPQIGNRVNEDIHINFNDYLNSSVESDRLANISKSLGLLSNLKDEMVRINQSLNSLNNITGATGLDLSLTTLKNLRHIFSGNSKFEPIDIKQHDLDVIKEVLEVDTEMATNIYYFFHHNHNSNSIEEVEGITEEIIERIKKNTK